ncbi:unnamed protein product [Sphagnum jensenii]
MNNDGSSSARIDSQCLEREPENAERLRPPNLFDKWNAECRDEPDALDRELRICQIEMDRRERGIMTMSPDRMALILENAKKQLKPIAVNKASQHIYK